MNYQAFTNDSLTMMCEAVAVLSHPMMRSSVVASNRSFALGKPRLEATWRRQVADVVVHRRNNAMIAAWFVVMP